MTGMNWFQAREIAKRRGAIRRNDWKDRWIIYRLYTWILVTFIEGAEARRVVRATDFADSEFLAKDWTNEPIEGLPVPPCATFPIATELIPLPTSGAWTTTEFCGGDGTGGVVDEPDPESEDLVVSLLIKPLTVGGAFEFMVPDSADSGGSCWAVTPTNFRVFIPWKFEPNLWEPGMMATIWFSSDAKSMLGEFTFGEPMPGAVNGVDSYMVQSVQQRPSYTSWYGYAGDFAPYDGQYVSGSFPFPGAAQEVSARVDIRNSDGVVIASGATSYFFATSCS